MDAQKKNLSSKHATSLKKHFIKKILLFSKKRGLSKTQTNTPQKGTPTQKHVSPKKKKKNVLFSHSSFLKITLRVIGLKLSSLFSDK